MDPIKTPEGTASAVATPSPVTIETAAPAAAVPSTPVVEAAAPVAPVVAEAPKVEAPAQTVPEPVKVEVPKSDSTILGGAPKVEVPKTPDPANKPAEGEKPAEQTKAEGSPSAEPAPLPTYEQFTLPEGIQFDDKKLGEFTKELGDFEALTKADHGEMQKFGQKLMDRYVAESQETIKKISDYYTNTWEKTKNEMREQFIKDPELGGNRQETTAATVQDFVSEFGGSQEQIAELRKYMDTGIGNKLELIRLMNNAATEVQNLRMKYESESGTRPLPGQKPETVKKSKTQTLYGRSSAAS